MQPTREWSANLTSEGQSCATAGEGRMVITSRPSPSAERHKLQLKSGYHVIAPRVETRRFQAMVPLDSTAVQPHLGPYAARVRRDGLQQPPRAQRDEHRGAAVQADPFVESKLWNQFFTSANFGTSFFTSQAPRVGSPGAFKLWVSTGFSLYTAPPRGWRHRAGPRASPAA
jgi:hypothetical protein